MVAGLALLGTVAAVLVNLEQIAEAEAQANAVLVGLVGLADAEHIQRTVVFFVDNRLVGFVVTVGCSVGLLLVPPISIIAVLLVGGRLSLRRALAACMLIGSALVLVNQLRLSAAVGSMKLWGFERGYEISHVFIGSMVTSVGLVLAIAIFASVLTKTRILRTGSNER
ncbi:hypothetical protein O7632_23445 [Solwaraspora sp. WMMD406]|uniref:hypothetical protein n=1 Tax=Solwaraspora sp. WMMD406 TaxID=3016095 RepID=UPI002417E6ED|nr:hypothetical protein [Solwaraspora sp. WMMD406]MDG4767029.1 hypothetical protein [Solwaraspora sp. WMMD406]